LHPELREKNYNPKVNQKAVCHKLGDGRLNKRTVFERKKKKNSNGKEAGHLRGQKKKKKNSITPEVGGGGG